MEGFYFLVKFFFSYLYIKTCFSSSFFWIKYVQSIHSFHSSFEKHVLSQVLKDFSVENLEATPSTFLSKFSIYLKLLIIGVKFLHYI